MMKYFFGFLNTVWRQASGSPALDELAVNLTWSVSHE
jgi:hypothetical protein